MLVLSLFPGIGLLDLAFEEEGFCVVRGPDLIFGGDIRRFHPPAGRFDGVIGGPPCQLFSGLANFSYRWKVKPENLIPEFERVVEAAAPAWFLMENVPLAPLATVPRYQVSDVVLNNRWLGEEQERLRRFCFGVRDAARPQALPIEVAALEAVGRTRTVTSSHGGGRPRMAGTIESLSVEEALRRQGLPADFFGHRNPLSKRGQLKVVAQGVPLPMGRAVARAVKRALAAQQEAA